MVACEHALTTDSQITQMSQIEFLGIEQFEGRTRNHRRVHHEICE